MAKIALTSREWCELVFEGRNKNYGAYELRKTSPKRHNIAMLIILIAAIVAFSMPALLKLAIPARVEDETITTVTELSQFEAPEEQEQQEVVKPDLPPPPPLKSSIKFVPPKPVKDEEVPEDEEIRTQDELIESNVAISIADVQGTDEVNGKDIAEVQEVVEEAPKEDDKVYEIVEQKAEFPGGIAEFQKFVYEHLEYPESARENNLQGTVYIRFIVSKTGEVSNVEVLRGFDPDCNQAAVKAVQQSPKWQPAKQNGHSVNSYYQIPIRFRLRS